MKRIYQFLLGSLLLLPLQAFAVLDIVIEKADASAIPIAIVPFSWQGATTVPKQDMAQIIGNDLRNSGRYSPVPRNRLPASPDDAAKVNYDQWKNLNAEYLVVGQLRMIGPDSYQAQFQLIQVFKQQVVIGFTFAMTGEQIRGTAHKISDLIFEKLTGIPGSFSTRIAYITETGKGKSRRFTLEVADYDGYDPQIILRSKQPLMSPAWSPDGSRLAYVSFEQNRSRIFVQELRTGSRRAVTDYPGINGAPAWSPDGQKLAVTLSKDGNPEIYVLNLVNRQLKRLTVSGAIDTEAVWSPNGQFILFTSDRGGSPQIYQVPATGGRAERVTFEGKYNASATMTSDRQKMAMVYRENGRFFIAVQDLASQRVSVLTEGALDESPSFAPNGSMIIYATVSKGRQMLGVISTDGLVQLLLPLRKGGIREPVWSPR